MSLPYSDIEHTGISKLITIRSKDKEKTAMTHTNFRVDLGSASQVHEVKRVSLRACKFPNTYYNVNSYCNVLIVIGTSAGTQTLTITEGFYTTTELLAAIKTAYDTAFSPSVITFTQDTNTNIISWSITSDTIQFIDVNTNALSTLAPKIGVTATAAVGSSGTFDMSPSLFGLTTAFLKSRELSAANSVSSEQVFGNTLAVIPVNVAWGSMNIYEPQDHELTAIKFKTPKDIRFIDLILTDDEGREIDLNGYGIEVQLKMWV